MTHDDHIVFTSLLNLVGGILIWSGLAILLL